MKKKILCAIMSAVMVVGALTGCGKKNDFKSTEKVTESATEAVAETEVATESTEEKDEYLTIDTSTICSRELHDFFQLYLGCWLEKYHQPDCKKSSPQGINEMLEYTGIVGAFTPAEGMRIVEDYDIDNFPGLREEGTGEGAFEVAFKHRYQLDKGTVNYSCSVSKLDANFSSFKYKAGTDAELRLFVNVKYNCSGVTNDSEEKMYAVSLLNNADNPEEWLINAIYDAHNLTEKEKEENPGYSYYVYFGHNSSQDPLFVTDKLIDEDREVVDTTNMSGWKKAYIDYINGLDGKVTGYKFVDVNSDGQPELCIEYAGGIDAELLNCTKSGDVQSISAMHADSEFAYGDGKIVDGIMRTGVASDRVYSYNSSTGEFDVIFNGQYNGYDTDTPNNYCLGTQDMEQKEQVTKEEYESKLKEARGNTEYTWLWGDFLTDDVIAAIQKTEIGQQENSNLTAGKQAYDVEEEVNKIRDIYYWVQGDSSNLTKQDGGSVTRWIDSNGKIRKIVAPAGTYDDTNGADAAKYNAEFYYNENEELVFVFLYSGKEEHRLYVVQGKCVRYIAQDRSVNDYPELKEADHVCGLGYFIGLGMMEIHYAHV